MASKVLDIAPRRSPLVAYIELGGHKHQVYQIHHSHRQRPHNWNRLSCGVDFLGFRDYIIVIDPAWSRSDSSGGLQDFADMNILVGDCVWVRDSASGRLEVSDRILYWNPTPMPSVQSQKDLFDCVTPSRSPSPGPDSHNLYQAPEKFAILRESIAKADNAIPDSDDRKPATKSTIQEYNPLAASSTHGPIAPVILTPQDHVTPIPSSTNEHITIINPTQQEPIRALPNSTNKPTIAVNPPTSGPIQPIPSSTNELTAAINPIQHGPTELLPGCTNNPLVAMNSTLPGSNTVIPESTGVVAPVNSLLPVYEGTRVVSGDPPPERASKEERKKDKKVKKYTKQLAESRTVGSAASGSKHSPGNRTDVLPQESAFTREQLKVLRELLAGQGQINPRKHKGSKHRARGDDVESLLKKEHKAEKRSRRDLEAKEDEEYEKLVKARDRSSSFTHSSYK